MDSKKAFFHTIMPTLELEHSVKGATHINILENDFSELMNKHYGIDYFAVEYDNGHGSQILASKIQWFETYYEAMKYNAISIRWAKPDGKLSELEKDSYKLSIGDIYSTYTLHAYLYENNNEFRVARINIADTKKLHEAAGIDMAKRTPSMLSTIRYNLDGSSFIDVNMEMYNFYIAGNLYGKNECQRNLEKILNGGKT